MLDPDAYTSVPDRFDGRDQIDVQLPVNDCCSCTVICDQEVGDGCQPGCACGCTA